MGTRFSISLKILFSSPFSNIAKKGLTTTNLWQLFHNQNRKSFWESWLAAFIPLRQQPLRWWKSVTRLKYVRQNNYIKSAYGIRSCLPNLAVVRGRTARKIYDIIYDIVRLLLWISLLLPCLCSSAGAGKSSLFWEIEELFVYDAHKKKKEREYNI